MLYSSGFIYARPPCLHSVGTPFAQAGLYVFLFWCVGFERGHLSTPALRFLTRTYCAPHLMAPIMPYVIVFMVKSPVALDVRLYGPIRYGTTQQLQTRILLEPITHMLIFRICRLICCPGSIPFARVVACLVQLVVPLIPFGELGSTRCIAPAHAG